VVGDGGILDPRLVDDELETGVVQVEVRGQMERETEGDDGGGEREPCGKLAADEQEGGEHSACRLNK
jgi:hypothetical protein